MNEEKIRGSDTISPAQAREMAIRDIEQESDSDEAAYREATKKDFDFELLSANTKAAKKAQLKKLMPFF